MLSRNYSMHNALFFVVYVFVGGVFVMNLFVGFIGRNSQKSALQRFSIETIPHR